MPPQYEKQLLEKAVQLTEENNKILKGLRSSTRWSIFFSLIKWAIIIVPIVLAYAYFQPYFGVFKENTQTVLKQLRAIQGIGTKIDQLKIVPDNIVNKLKIPSEPGL